MSEVIRFPGTSRPRAIVTPVKMPIAFRIGALAHESGLPFISNPFSPVSHTAQHQEWADGWMSDCMGGSDG
jgi:hypothetical protein